MEYLIIWKLFIEGEPPQHLYFTDEQSAWDYLKSYYKEKQEEIHYIKFGIQSVNVLKYTKK